jgi:DDE superfamily endonuclease
MTHDYKCNGTTDLFAALNVGTGEVLTATRKSTDVLAFFKWIDLHVDPDLEIHVVLDNLSAHKAPPVVNWLAHPKRARWHLHFTPTSSSWLNLVDPVLDDECAAGSMLDRHRNAHGAKPVTGSRLDDHRTTDELALGDRPVHDPSFDSGQVFRDDHVLETFEIRGNGNEANQFRRKRRSFGDGGIGDGNHRGGPAVLQCEVVETEGEKCGECDGDV